MKTTQKQVKMAVATLLLSSAFMLSGNSVWAGKIEEPQAKAPSQSDVPDEKAQDEAKSAREEQAKAPEQQVPAQEQTQVPAQQEQSQAKAPVSSEMWSCTLHGKMAGLGVSFLLGGQYISGRGHVLCSRGEQSYRYPVRLKILSGGLGFDFTIIRAMWVRANIQNVYSPEDLYGEYHIGSTSGATLITKNVERDSTVLVVRDNAIRENNMGFEVAITGKDTFGLGVRLHGMIFTVESL